MNWRSAVRYLALFPLVFGLFFLAVACYLVFLDESRAAQYVASGSVLFALIGLLGRVLIKPEPLA